MGMPKLVIIIHRLEQTLPCHEGRKQLRISYLLHVTSIIRLLDEII